MVRTTLSLSAMVLLAMAIWFILGGTSSLRSATLHEHAFVGDDYPPSWPLHVAKVGMYPEDTHRYALDTVLGLAEWRTMLPPGGGFIHLGPDGRRFGVTMFHQLQCLDIIREALVDTSDAGPKDITHHCMNYLRQMALCQSHTALESVRGDRPPKVVDLTRSLYECRDWTALYKGAEDNYLHSMNGKRKEDMGY